MKKTFILFLTMSIFNNVYLQTFLEKQKTYPRVQAAYKEKLNSLEVLLMSASLSLTDLEIFIRIFKQEKLLEVWGKKKKDTTFKLVSTYTLCATSGKLGPKRAQGDEQMPEGIYNIVNFNPTSNFYLSLKINYPNASDLKFCKNNKCGTDIFIHGNCVTTGCFPIGDEAIKELYILAIEATSQGQTQIPVHIFPTKLNEKNFADIVKIYPQHEEFWKSLKPIYEYFETYKKLPKITIESTGYYKIVN